jgi:hypothetical protein
MLVHSPECSTDGMQIGIVIADWMIFGLLKHTKSQEFIWRFPVAFQGAFGIFTAVSDPTQDFENTEVVGPC